MQVSSNWRCKIADFGLAQLKEAGRSGKKSQVKQKGSAEKDGNGIGSLLWCAPEVLQNSSPTAGRCGHQSSLQEM